MCIYVLKNTHHELNSELIILHATYEVGGILGSLVVSAVKYLSSIVINI